MNHGAPGGILEASRPLGKGHGLVFERILPAAAFERMLFVPCGRARSWPHHDHDDEHEQTRGDPDRCKPEGESTALLPTFLGQLALVALLFVAGKIVSRLAGSQRLLELAALCARA